MVFFPEMKKEVLPKKSYGSCSLYPFGITRDYWESSKPETPRSRYYFLGFLLIQVGPRGISFHCTPYSCRHGPIMRETRTLYSSGRGDPTKKVL